MATVKPVKDWTNLSDATAALAAELPADYETNKALIEGHDPWQNGLLWPGRRTGDPVVDAALLAKVKPQLISDDVVGELTENRSDGLIGQEAAIGLEPLEPAEGDAAQAQQKEIAGILGPLFAWWDKKRFWEKIGTANKRESWASRAAVRAWIAEANLINGALPTGRSFAEALDIIELDAPLPDAGGRVTDVATQREVGVIVSDVVVNGLAKKRAEVWTVDPVTKVTIHRLFTFGQGEAPGAALSFNLGGRLPIAEMRGTRIIDPSVVKLQSLLNFALTYATRTIETAGARERYLGNVEPQLLWLTSRPTSTPVEKIKTDETGATFYGVRDPWLVGGDILNELVGLETPVTDAAGKVLGYTHETPSVTALDPVDTTPIIENAADAITRRLYKRGKQGHLALSGTAEASGIAYQQARAQFEADLKGMKGAAEGMIRDILEVVLAFAGLMSTEVAGVLDRYRVVVTLHPSAGPITAEEANLAVTLRDKRAISQQTLLARVGNEDTVAEQAAIDADPLNLAAQWTAIANAMSALLNATGMTPQAAGWLLKLTPEQIQVFVTGEPPAQTQPGAAPTPLQLTA